MSKDFVAAVVLPLLLSGCSCSGSEGAEQRAEGVAAVQDNGGEMPDDATCRAAFVDYMNRKAERMGMQQTHFADASGYVAEGSAITARDAVLLACKAQSCAPIAAVWWQKQHAMRVGGPNARVDTIGSLDKAVFTVRYQLLGCKTGTLGGQAGVVLLCQDAQGERYAAAVLGSVHEQRWRDARRLVDMAGQRMQQPAAAVDDRELRAAGAAVCRMPLVYVPWQKALPVAWLYQRALDKPLLPASVTKTMTAICMLDFVDNLDDTFTIKASDLMSGSGPRFKEGDVLSYREALYAMFLPSSNTAAVAVARAVGQKMVGR